MRKNDLSKIFNGELYPDLIKHGYKKIRNNLYKAEKNFGFDSIGFWFTKYDNDYNISLTCKRRFDLVERSIGEIMPLINVSYSNDGSDETMIFDENYLNGITTNCGSKTYSISNGNYLNSLDSVIYAIHSRFLPFLASVNTIEKLDLFINDPPSTFGTKTMCFALDGGTIFRKMVIAKLANKNYEEVSNFVLNKIQNEFKPTLDHLKYSNYINAYFELKTYLEN